MTKERLTRTFPVALCLLCLFASGAAGRQKASNLQGFWEGTVTREGKVWRVNFEITRAGADEGLKAVADFIDAGGIDRAFTVEFDAPHVRMERPQPGGAPIVFDGSVAGDLLAGVRLLKSRRDVDPRRIAVAGHSQGGTIAPLAAVESADVAFVISSAPSAVNYAEQSVYHRANVMRESGFSEEEVKTASDLHERLYATGRMLLANDPRAEDERRKLSAELGKYKDAPWLAAAALPPNLDDDKPTRGGLELLFFEPLPVWKGLRVPVLFIWGDKDTVVPVEKGRAIIEGARRASGNRDYTIKVVPNVTHALTIFRTQGASWDFPRVASDYLDATADWLAARVRN